MTETLQKTGLSRLFTLAGGASPATSARYQGRGRAMGVSWAQGDVTPVRIPSRRAYDQFDTVTTLRGQQGLPVLPLQFRMATGASEVLSLVRNGCPVTLQNHVGVCERPDDFNGGWLSGKIQVLELAYPTDYSTSELGALDSDQRAMVMEDIPFTGLDYYEIVAQTFASQAGTVVTDEVVDITIADDPTCGDCGVASDGCQKVFALVAESSGSPGISAAVVWTDDGGATWSKSAITSLGIGTDASAIARVGSDIVVISEVDEAYHYAPIADILNGDEVWTRVATGFVTGNGPRAIYSFGNEAWIAGANGYVYKLATAGNAVTVLDSGGATTNDYNAITGIEDKDLVLVGASNTVVYSRNGGVSFSTVTGPAAGVDATAVAMTSDKVWFVGNASGDLYYTVDAGVNFTQKAFSGDGSGQVYDVAFVNQTVGYMLHDNRLFRTIDGGNTWVQQPYGGGSFPSNTNLNAIAVCEDPNANLVYIGGLGIDANDGVIIKGS